MWQGGVSPFETYKFRQHDIQPHSITTETFYSSSGRSFYRPPVYPLFLAGIYRVFGINPIIVKRIQLGLLCFGACLLIPIGFISASKTGLLAGLFSSWVFVFSFYGICTDLYSEPLLTFIASFLMLSWLLVLKRQSIPTAIILGFMLGLSILSKGGFYVTVVLIIGHLIYRYYKHRDITRFRTFFFTAFTALLTVIPYVVWQNLTSNLVFISQDGPATLLGGNNEFTADGDWISLNDEPPGYYSTLPKNMSAVSKVLSYYTEFPERIIPNAYYKLRNSLLRPVAGSVLVYACITFLLFALFKKASVRILILIGVSAYLGINFLSNNYLHYRFIETNFLFVFIIINFSFAGLISLVRQSHSNSIVHLVFPFGFPLFLLTLVLYGYYRIVMPFYLASLLLGFWVFIKLITEMLLSPFISQLWVRVKSSTTRTRFNYTVLFLLPWLIPFGISEIYLRFDGGLDTYAEKTGNFYRSYFNQEPPSLYWSHPMNTTYTIDQGDFSYEYKTNELGLREKRNSFSRPDTNAFRILTLGDSFTEGFGTSGDSAWPRVLETSFDTVITHSKKIQIYNAGMAGSDPFFNYRMLKDKLLPFAPHLVIQTVNTSDLSDYLFRGGKNRFREGRVVFRKGPWWELLYRFSYTFRLFVHNVLGCNSMLVAPEFRSRIYDEAVSEYLSLFTQDYNELAKKFGFSIVYVIQPMPSDLRFVEGDYQRLMKLDSLLKRNNEVSIDLLESMFSAIGKDSAFVYSWKIDGHYNGRGYNVMGNMIADSLTKRIPFQPVGQAK
jgi:hypothetical protein